MNIFRKVETKNALLLFAVLVLLFFTMLSCSKSPKDPDSTDETELSSEGDKYEDDDSLLSGDSYGDDEFSDDEGGYKGTDDKAAEDDFYSEGDSEKASEEKASEDTSYQEGSTDELFADEGNSYGQENNQSIAPAASQGMIAYSVQRGDTLLKISFKVFRSYERWRELLQYNPEIQNPNIIEVGQQINYPSEYQQRVVANVRGEYWIKPGQTLGTISQELYGTPAYWREIANLNPEKIRNPNRIYAGTSINVTLSGIQRVEPGQKVEEDKASEYNEYEEEYAEYTEGEKTTEEGSFDEGALLEEEVVEEVVN